MKISKVVLYGINADPPHNGHLKVALEVQKALGQETLIVVMPTGIHPHNKPQCASFSDRLYMTQLLFQGYSHIVVDDFEGRSQKAAYTLETLQYLHGKYKATSYSFIMATDVLNHFFSWHKPQAILSLATPIVVPRKGFDLDLAVFEKLKNFTPVLFIDFEGIKISSTEIRQDLNKGHFPDELPASIKSYIQEKRLYNC